MLTTSRLGLKKIELTDSPPDITVLNTNWDIIEQYMMKGDSSITSMAAGSLANRPAAGTLGRIYIATDEGIIYRDNGTTWDNLTGRAGKGTGSLPTTGWETTSGDYTKRYTFAITGVTADDVVNISIDKDAHDIAQGAELCPTSESYAGGIYFYAKNIPAAAIAFSYVVLK